MLSPLSCNHARKASRGQWRCLETTEQREALICNLTTKRTGPGIYWTNHDDHQVAIDIAV